MKKIIVVLNNFQKADDLLQKAIILSQKHNAFLEVLYIHETALFDLPDYFRVKESLTDNGVDKDKVEKEIKERILKFGFENDYAILVFVADTIDRVLINTREDIQTLILIEYHKKMTQQLVKKSHLPLLIVKNSVIDYKKIVLPVDLGENMHKCINLADTIFPNIEKRLLFDYRNVVDTSNLDVNNLVIPTMNPLLNMEINKELKKNQLNAFEDLKKKTGFDGDFIEEALSLEDDLSHYINISDSDLTILYSNKEEFLFSDSLCFSLLETLSTDILIQGYAKQELLA